MSYILNASHTLTETPKLHYRFDDFTDLVGTRISEVLDQSGNGYHLSQPTPANQPRVSDTSNPDIDPINRVTALRFTGDEYLSAPGPFDNDKSYSIVTVFENHHEYQVTKPANVAGTLFSLSVSADSTYYGLLYQTANPTNGRYDSTQYNNGGINSYLTVANWLPSTPNVLFTDSSSGIGGDFAMWINNEERPLSASSYFSKYTAPSTSIWSERGPYDRVNIGSTGPPDEHVGYNHGFHGRIHEVFLFENRLTESDMDILREYLRQKYRYDGSYMVDDKCVTIQPDGWTEITNPDDAIAMSMGAKESNVWPSDSQTVEYWVQFDGIVTQNNRGSNTSGYWYKPVVEHIETTVNANNYNYYKRHYLSLYPATGSLYAYVSPALNVQFRLADKQWYHFKFVRTDINAGTSLTPEKWHMRWYLNGREMYSNNVNTAYEYLNVTKTTFGSHPDEEEWPTQYHSDINKAPLADRPIMRLAGYRVTSENLSGTNTYDLSGNMTATGTTRPSTRQTATTTAPRVLESDLGAAIDARRRVAGINRPPILGKYEMTTAYFAPSFVYVDKQLSNLNFIKEPGVCKAFKQTAIDLSNNKLTDITGLRDLYSVEDGPGNDTPTGPLDFNFTGNRITDLTDLTGSTFSKHLLANNFYLTSNPLSSLNGIGEFKEVRYLRINNTYTLENVDDLANVRWDFNSTQILMAYARVKSTNTYWLSGITGPAGYIDCNYGEWEDLSNWDNDGMRSITMQNQRSASITNLDQFGPQTGLRSLLMNNCTFDVTALPANATTLWPQLDTIDVSDTNIEDISVLAELSGKPQGVYGVSPEEIHPITGLSGGDYALYYQLQADWSLSTANPTTGTTRNDTLAAAYNSGNRICVIGGLHMSNTPISDIRVFEDSYQWLGARSTTNLLSNGDGVLATQSTWYPHRGDIFYTYFDNTGITDTANGIGKMKNWILNGRLSLKANGLSTLNNLFVDSGFADATWTRYDFQDKETFHDLRLHDNNISNLSFMLRANFAGVYTVYLNDNPVDYSDVAAIATDLINLKNAGDINLVNVYMTDTTWEQGHDAGGVNVWNNPSYYNFDGTHYNHDLMYPVYFRCDEFFGFGDNPSPQQQLKLDLHAAGIILHFPGANSSTNPQQLGATANYEVYPNTFLDTHDWRWGTQDVAGRLVWTETSTTPDASNTLTLTFSPSFDIPAGSIILIKHLTGTGTSDNANLTITGTGSTAFGSSGSWTQSTGNLELTVAAGQSFTHDQLYSISFTLINPSDNTGANGSTNGRIPVIDAWDDRSIQRATNFYFSGEYVMDIP